MAIEICADYKKAEYVKEYTDGCLIITQINLLIKISVVPCSMLLHDKLYFKNGKSYESFLLLL